MSEHGNVTLEDEPSDSAAATATRGAPSEPVGQPAGGKRRRKGLMAAIGAGALLVVGGAVAIVVSEGNSPKPGPPPPKQVIATATPSIVRIEGKQGGGSGVVIDAAQQLVLTNAHVVDGNSAFTAQVGNDTTTSTPVRVVATDPCDDLALVKLVNPVPNLRAVPLGSAASVSPGDQVIALGFPGSAQSSLQGQQTATGQSETVIANTGTVSQTGVQSATDPALPTYQDLIVHQAPINPGDSGGALLDQYGHLIGINTLSGASTQGQYYAISIDYAKRLIPELESGQSQGALGWELEPLSSTDPSLAQELIGFYGSEGFGQSTAVTTVGNQVASYLQQNDDSGVLVTGEDSGSPADKSNLNVGDLITSINGNPVHSFSDVCQNIQSATPGQTLHLNVLNVGDFNDTNQFVTKLQDPNLDADITVPAH